MAFGPTSRSYPTPWSGQITHFGPVVVADINLVIVAALCLYGTSASAAALTMEECRAKYKGELAESPRGIENWMSYQETQCGHPSKTARNKKSKK